MLLSRLIDDHLGHLKKTYDLCNKILNHLHLVNNVKNTITVVVKGQEAKNIFYLFKFLVEQLCG